MEYILYIYVRDKNKNYFISQRHEVIIKVILEDIIMFGITSGSSNPFSSAGSSNPFGKLKANQVAYFDANKIHKGNGQGQQASAIMAFREAPPLPEGCGSKLDLQAC